MLDYNSYVQQLLTLKQREIKLKNDLKKIKEERENLTMKRLKEREQELKQKQLKR